MTISRRDYYTKIAKFRRRPIEKYSTRRYNVNTKRIKVTARYLRFRKLLRASKRKQRDARSRRHSVNTSNSLTTGNLSGDGTCSDPNTNTDRVVAHPDIEIKPSETLSAQRVQSLEVLPADTSVIPCNLKAGKVDLVVDNGSCCSSDQQSNSKICRGFERKKLVSLEFYTHLAKIAKQEKTVVKQPKRRKWKWTPKPKKKKYLQSENNTNLSLRDPYSENFENLGSESIHTEENISMIIHLGVGRPLFPVIHRNIVKLCGWTDTKITDMWAEFSLSTLIMQPFDCHVKKLLMPVVDDQLLLVISDFNKEYNVDFDEVEMKKVIQHPDLSLTDVETELDAPATSVLLSPRKKAARGTFRSKKKSSKTKKGVSIIEQIYQQSLKNKQSIDSHPCGSSVVLDDDEILRRKHGFKPCWVVLPRCQTNRSPHESKKLVLIDGGDDESSALPVDKKICTSPNKKDFHSAVIASFNQTILSSSTRASHEEFPKDEISIARKKPSKQTKLPVLSATTKKFALQNKNSPASSPPLDSKKKKASVQDPKSFISGTNQTTMDKKVSIHNKDLSSITHLNETVSSPIAMSRKRSIVLDKKSTPPPPVIQMKDEGQNQNSPMASASRIASPQPAAAGQKMFSLPPQKSVFVKSFEKKPVFLNQKKYPQATNLTHGASPNTARKQLSFSKPQTLSVETDHGLEPLAPSTVLVEIFSDSVDDNEWLSMPHYFGPRHCSRTFGSMLDYIPRNRTLIYFFKMRRILNFQTRNNKYIQSCFYCHIQRTMEDDFVDVEGYDEPTTGLKPFKDVLMEKGLSEPFTRKPLEILQMPKKKNAFGSLVLTDTDSKTQFHFRPIEKDRLSNLANTKWIILRLDQDVKEIIYNQKSRFAAKLLFEVMFRADLTKKIICFTIQDGSGEYGGLYGIPGICDAVFLGPCPDIEQNYSLEAILQLDFGAIKTVEIPISNVRTVTSVNQASAPNIEAVWWRPVHIPLKVSSINGTYLNFLFKWNTGIVSDKETPKIRQSTLCRQHPAVGCATFRSDCGDNHYVLMHNCIRAAPPLPSAANNCKAVDLAYNVKKTQTRPYSNLDITEENVLPEVRPRTEEEILPTRQPRIGQNIQPTKLKRQRKYPNLPMEAALEISRQREHERRKTLSKNHDLLSTMVGDVVSIPHDITLNTVVKESMECIEFLKNKDQRLMMEKQMIIEERERLVGLFLRSVRAMTNRIAAYKITREVLSQLVPPKNAERVISEEEQRQVHEEDQSQFHEEELRQLCEKEQKPNLPPVQSLPENPAVGGTSYNVRATPRRRKRRRRGATNPVKEPEHSKPQPQSSETLAMKSSSAKPVHVTVQSGDHIIGLGPYLEHNYCNFEELQGSGDLVEDPLADANAVKDTLDTVDVYEKAKLQEIDTEKEDADINMCVTRDGEPIFKMTITRSSSGLQNEERNSVACGSGVCMKTVIQNILQKIPHRLNKDGSNKGNVVNHVQKVQMLRNIFSDVRNTNVLSTVSADCKHVKSEHNDDVQIIDDESPPDSNVEVNSISGNQSVHAKPQTAEKAHHIPERIVSFGKMTDKSAVSEGVNRISNNASKLRQLLDSIRFSRVPSTSAADKRVLLPTRGIRLKCVPSTNNADKRVLFPTHGLRFKYIPSTSAANKRVLLPMHVVRSTSVPSTSTTEKRVLVPMHVVRPTSVSSTSAVEKKVLLPTHVAPEECIIEEECIEDSPPAEESRSRNEIDASGLKKHFVSPKKNTVPMRSLSLETLPTLPLLKSAQNGRLQVVQKTLPILLRKSNAGVSMPKSNYTFFRLENVQSGSDRVRCPSFVPVTGPALCDSVRNEERSTSSTPGSKNATNPSSELMDEKEEEDLTIVELTSLGSAQNSICSDATAEDGRNSVCSDATAEDGNGENDVPPPFRLSVKPFASLGTLKDGMNVNKLLKY